MGSSPSGQWNPGPPPFGAPRRRRMLPWILGAAAIVVVLVLGVAGIVMVAGQGSRSAPPAPAPKNQLPAPPNETAQRVDGAPQAKYGYPRKPCDAVNLKTLTKFADQVNGNPRQQISKTDPIAGLGGSYIMFCRFSLTESAAEAKDIKHLSLDVEIKVGYGAKATEIAHDDYTEQVKPGGQRVTGVGERAVATFGNTGADEGGRTLGQYELAVVDDNLYLDIMVNTTGSFDRNAIVQSVEELARDSMRALQVS